MMEWTGERVAWLRERAGTAAGFTLAGVAAVDGVTEAERVDGERFATWVDAGFAGEMEYLKRRDEDGRLLRSAMRVAVPWARSVVLCAMNYRAEAPLSIERADGGAGWIGRYAWSGQMSPGGDDAVAAGPSTKWPTASSTEAAISPRSPALRVSSLLTDGAGSKAGLASTEGSLGAGTREMKATDYHEVLLRRLRLLEAEIQREMPCETRCYVDTGPMVERAVAARAGVGWIGKNTTVINQEVGSWTLLASIITSIPMAASGLLPEAADRCGSCTRCLEACPTEALIAPHQMDARRCIAYLTIEKKGPIAEELRGAMGRQVFGCDICQDVCPWNRRSPAAADAGLLPRRELINPDLEWLAAMSTAEFRQWFKGSPLERTGKKRLHRNVAIAMGNSGEERFRGRLTMWAGGEDPVLAEAARWALGRLQSGPRPAATQE